jgi:hypothetical protein
LFALQQMLQRDPQGVTEEGDQPVRSSWWKIGRMASSFFSARNAASVSWMYAKSGFKAESAATGLQWGRRSPPAREREPVARTGQRSQF